MRMNSRVYAAGGATIAIFVLVQIGALVLVEPFQSAGYQPVENPSNPTNTLLYLLGVFAATGVMLTAFRFGADRLVHVLIVGSSAFLSYYVLSVVLPSFGTGIGATHLPAAGISLVLAIALFVYPEWYIIDTIGIIMGMGAAGLFGISLGLLPAILLLTVLAVYDAISVYKTEHMLTLASGVMDLKIPVVLVIPLTLSYSYIDSPPERMDQTDENEESEESNENEAETAAAGSPDSRGAFFIGLGDAVMPSVLVASAAFFLPTAPLVPGFALTLPALTAMIGTLCGLIILIKMVMEGRPHAGLPLLNGGAIVGYLLGASVSGVPLVRALGLIPYL
ncbi:presenilin family intramembrane aspartyl protease PSH [Halocatena marina]|uniref:presenilin family intramembrane aspartyl protease PSH n=1 Tax=Halocatena marina TaxID=2934937 RepID=UPI0022259A32|nr:presenilin family intramembrane aspartyl protease PSH [Halocatena marina]